MNEKYYLLTKDIVKGHISTTVFVRTFKLKPSENENQSIKKLNIRSRLFIYIIIIIYPYVYRAQLC